MGWALATFSWRWLVKPNLFLQSPIVGLMKSRSNIDQCERASLDRLVIVEQIGRTLFGPLRVHQFLDMVLW